jgi:diguanylate cyclase (GGDEF)-like protein
MDGQPGDVLEALAIGLAVEVADTGRRVHEVIKVRSPELVRAAEESGEDLAVTSASFMDILVASLTGDVEVTWVDQAMRWREYGRMKAAQGVPLETLIDVLAIYRRATVELVMRPIEGTERGDEIFTVAQSRLEDVIERLTNLIVRGYLDHLDAEHRRREGELYGLAAIVSAMSRSLDVSETAEVALVETLAALRLTAGAVWLRERSVFKLVTSAGLEPDQIDEFAAKVGPQVRAAVTAIGRSESRVDRGLGGSWNALRAQLRVKGRTVGVITVATQMQRVFGASDLLFTAAVADQVALALDRARQFSNEARTDHLTGLANRREFERIMEREVALAERHGRQLSMMLIDVDNFKRINDRQGHRAGDSALKLLGQQLQRVVRTSDICGRLGGDEFGVAMPETELSRAHEVASRLRSAMREMSLSARLPAEVEVSIGLAAWGGGQDWQAMYQAADTYLYEDKRRRKHARRLAEAQPPAATGRMQLLGRSSSGRKRLAGN